MDEFNYLSVLISIILGLGITRLLKGLGQQIEYRTRITRYWPALCWALILLLIHVQSWWAMFGMREHRGWDFLTFTVVLLQPIVLYLLAALVLPTPGSGDTLDLREHYYAQSRWLFGLFVGLLLVSLVKTSMLMREAPRPADLLFHLVFIVLSATVAVSRRPRVHEVVAGTVAVLLAAYIALLFSQLR